jgi:hypothetical protein
MEYIIVVLPTTRKAQEILINDYAQKGWFIICALTDCKLIFGRLINK